MLALTSIIFATLTDRAKRPLDMSRGSAKSTISPNFAVRHIEFRATKLVADANKIGKDWTPDELDAIVDDYFSMLLAERAGAPYVKAHHARDLMARIGRTHRSVEFKHMNISAVLGELGIPTIRGYRPKHNYQNAIFGAVDRYITTHPELLSDGYFGLRSDAAVQIEDVSAASPALSASTFLQVAEAAEVYFDERPAVPGAPRPERPPALERLVRKFDPVARDFRNRTLGREGEALVFEFERKRLEAADRPDLARKVRWVAQEDGDGAGYDIHSFSSSGEDRLIEVKTTLGVRTTPFFITRNELSLSEEHPAQFRLYRLYEAAQTPRILRVRPPLRDRLTLEAEAWRASVA